VQPDCRGQTFHPTIDLLLQISATNHPQVGATNPQERVSLYCPLTTQFYPQQTNFSYNYPNPPSLFPSTCTTQGMGSPFTTHSPSGLPTSLQGSNTGWLGISLVGDSRDVSCNRKNSQQQAHCCRVISHTKSHSTGLTTYFFMHLQLQTTTTHAHYGFLQAPTLLFSLVVPKTACKNCSLFPYKFPFFPCKLTLTLPNVDCTQPPCSHNYGM
jgi:hypothetical protein